MDYSPEQFFNLIGVIEEQGGTLTDELCASREYELVGPKGKAKDGTHKPLILPGCGNVSIFEVPYPGEAAPGTNAATLGTVKLCAVCDGLGGMPRFADAMEAD